MNKKQKALSRKAQGEETRAILIETGARLFAQNGYHGVSMRTLAAEAGVNLATVGYHFGGKAGLYEAIMDQIIAARDSFFPTAEEVGERLAAVDDNLYALADLVSWYIEKLARGMLGMKEHIWPAFLISRELAQPTELYPKLEKEFFTPSTDSLNTLVRGVLPEGTDREEIIITSQCIIGMVVKFLEGHDLVIQRLGWESYEGRGLDKIISILSKRLRGFLGLPMENA